MHQHDFAPWRAGRPFGFDEYLNLGLRVVKPLFDGMVPRAGWPGPEVRRNGLQVWVLEEGHERLQAVIIPQTRTIKAQVIGRKGGAGFWVLGYGSWRRGDAAKET
jgi:hypothetical protein